MLSLLVDKDWDWLPMIPYRELSTLVLQSLLEDPLSLTQSWPNCPVTAQPLIAHNSLVTLILTSKLVAITIKSPHKITYCKFQRLERQNASSESNQWTCPPNWPTQWSWETSSSKSTILTSIWEIKESGSRLLLENEEIYFSKIIFNI